MTIWNFHFYYVKSKAIGPFVYKQNIANIKTEKKIQNK